MRKCDWTFGPPLIWWITFVDLYLISAMTLVWWLRSGALAGMLLFMLALIGLAFRLAGRRRQPRALLIAAEQLWWMGLVLSLLPAAFSELRVFPYWVYPVLGIGEIASAAYCAWRAIKRAPNGCRTPIFLLDYVPYWRN